MSKMNSVLIYYIYNELELQRTLFLLLCMEDPALLCLVIKVFLMYCVLI